MKYRVTLVVEMDVEADNDEEAFEYVHHEATKNADFTVVESFDAVSLVDKPEERLRDFELGPCGCVDYHMADCSTISPPKDEPPDPDEGDWRE